MKSLLLSITFTIMALLTAIPARANEPAAASRAFTSKDPAVVKALGLVDAGKFTEAEALLAGGTGEEQIRDRSEAWEIIRRIRFEYSLEPPELLTKLQKTIPDVTAEDVEAWAKESKARYRMIDGKKFYFRREPQNIFLFSSEAKKRRAHAGRAPAEPKWQLLDHLKTIADEADQTGKVEVQPVLHKFKETLTLRSNAPGLKAGSLVRVWLPYPQEYRQQQNVKLLRASPEPKVIAPNAIEGNPVTGGAQRTVYMEQRVEDPTKPVQFKLSFEYTSYAYYPKLEEAKVQALPAGWNGANLSERAPHIVFTPEIRAQVAIVTGTETNALVKARKIFHWVSANIPWNAEDEYCIIPSLAVKGFTARRGDCGVQNTVFITMCRVAGIPARWQSGYETEAGRELGHARLGGNVYRAVGLAAGRCVVWREKIQRPARGGLLLRAPGQLPDDCESGLGP